jgi:hypothetical protein
MEHLFSPCTRLYDIVEGRGRLAEFREQHPALWKELNLDVSVEKLLSAEKAFTYADLYAMLGNENMVLWLTPHAAVVRADGRMGYSWGQLGESCLLCFSADGKQLGALARSPEHLFEICDVVLRLLAASIVHSVTLCKWGSPAGALINAASLAYLMEQCQSLKVLELLALESLDENHCRVLGAYSRPGLKIKLFSCKLTSAGASVLAEILGRNQGPTKLHHCFIDNSILADVLRGKTVV